MVLHDLDRRRIARDIAKYVEEVNTARNPVQSVRLLRAFGVSNATISIALGMTDGLVSNWFRGSRPCSPARKAELDDLLRAVCSIMLKSEEIPAEAWVVLAPVYSRALDYLGETCVVTPDERAMLSNAAGYMLKGGL
jgi:hypothetical protein